LPGGKEGCIAEADCALEINIALSSAKDSFISRSPCSSIVEHKGHLNSSKSIGTSADNDQQAFRNPAASADQQRLLNSTAIQGWGAHQAA
jgi:hypothetical protein